MTTPDPAAPAPIPTDSQFLTDLTEVFIKTGHPDAVALYCEVTRLVRERDAATLAHLAAQAPESVREMVHSVLSAGFGVGESNTPEELEPDYQAKLTALLAAFTALRGEVDHWKAEATVREERSEMWRTQYNNLRAATAANADHWDATEAALRQSLDAAVERAEAAEGVAAKWEAEVKDRQWVRWVTTCGLCGASFCGDAAGELHGLGKCDAALAPRGASDGEGR